MALEIQVLAFDDDRHNNYGIFLFQFRKLRWPPTINKTDCLDIYEILLKVALNTITLNKHCTLYM
jgi:hypothetical protein